MMKRVILLIVVAVSVKWTAPAWAWDEEGHIIVTRLAHAKLPERMPEWVRGEASRERLVYLCSEPDRWRGQKHSVVDHVNNPDHYFDADDLPDYELTLKTLPGLRREFTDHLALMRFKYPQRFRPRNAERDAAYTALVPGLLPYSIAELQWKTAGCWTTLKTYEENREYVSEEMLDNARQNVLFYMGLVSHFVGDGAQPLHMTKHHHGWIGANPKGYTTERTFHARIDGGVIAHHRITAVSLMARARPTRRVTTDGFFAEINEYLGETFALVEPLYELEKSGDLDEAKGKVFIEDRLLEGGAMLAGVWAASYDGARIDEFRVNQLKQAGRKRPSNAQPTHAASPSR